MAAKDVLHTIFELELAFLECGFFELLGVSQVGFGPQLVQPVIQLMMLRGESAKLLIILQQLFPEFLRCGHARPPWKVRRTSSGSDVPRTLPPCSRGFKQGCWWPAAPG